MITSALIISVVTFCVTYILHYLITQLRKYSSINKLPGPSFFELLGVLFKQKSSYDKYQYLVNLTKRYGPILKLWIKPFNPIVVTDDVDVLNRILLSKDHLRKTKTYDLTKSLFGEGIGITNKVDEWKRHRKIYNPVFQPSNIVEFLPLLQKHTNTRLEGLKDHLEKVVNLQPLLHSYALGVMFEFITKHEHYFGDNTDAFLNARNTFFTALSKRMYSVFLQNDILFRFSKYFKLRNEAIVVIKEFTQNIILSEKTRRKEASHQNSKLHLIDTLFATSLDMDYLRDEINTFITAGHDTTAETMCFILYELSKHSQVQQRLLQEILSLIGENGEVTNETLKAMTYLQAVINETLRLHTAGPVIERQLSSGVEINGIYYPADTRFILSLTGVHTSSKYFENPDKFDPERFMPENAHKINRQSFMPFSAGPRNCIGKLFAMLLLKYFVARVIQQYEILPVEGHNLQILGEIVAKSITGVPVILKSRRA